MINQFLVFFILIFYFVMANLPWFSDNAFLFKTTANKSSGLRWLEWVLLYGVSMGVGMLVEHKVMGVISPQDWEFYVVTFCLFVVLALPGFIYCYDLKNIIRSGKVNR